MIAGSLLVLACLFAASFAKIHLQVEKDGELGAFLQLTQFNKVRALVNVYSAPNLCYNCQGLANLTYNGLLWDIDENLPLAISGQFDMRNELLITNVTTPGYCGFSIENEYLLHDGESTFYSSNFYPYDKYIDVITTDKNEFLAEPIKLKVVEY